jgi:hypothetical protein
MATSTLTPRRTPTPSLEPVLPQGMIPLAPMASDGPPRHRLDDPTKATTIVANLFQASLERNLKNAAIQGQIDGNPPYNPAAMRRAGRAADANFNTLEAKALRSTAMVPYYDLFAGGNRYVEISLDLGDDWQAQYASGVVSEEYDALLRRWPNFEYIMYSMMLDYVTFGKGFLTWLPDPGSWHCQRIAHYRVFVPDATPVDLDQLELFVVFNNYPVTFLQAAIRDRAAATTAGWNVEETRRAMELAVPVDPSVPNDPLAAQSQLRDSDIYVSARSSTVQLASIYVKEFSGKWSHLIVRRDQIPSMSQSAAPTQPPAGFVFKSFSRYDTIQDCLNAFFFEPADANWNGTSGLGRDIFSFCQLKDRMCCTQADSVFLRNSIILQPRQETDRTKLQLMHLGRMTILPPGLEAQDSTILGDIASTIEVSRELSMQIERNTGIYRPTLEKGGGNPDTLGEFQTKFAQATVLSSSAITRFYSQLDRFYLAQFKRVLDAGSHGSYDLDAPHLDDSPNDWRNEARCFVARCKARGVDLATLRRAKWVRAYRAIGQGSAAMRQQIVSTFLNPQVFPYFPPDGQQNILEDFTRTLGGQTAVNRYLPPSARLALPDDQQWAATMENATMREGSPALWTPAQNNIIHAQIHLSACAQAAASIEQGADPATVLAFLDLAGPHIQEHLQHESSRPASQAAVKALDQQWKRLAAVADKIRAMLQQTADQQRDLQEQQQKVLTDADIKLMETQAKLQQSQTKLEGTLALKQQRQEAELALKQQQLAGDHAMRDASAAADISRSTAETQASLVQDAARTAADIAAKQAKTAADIEAARAKAAAAASKPGGRGD